MSELNQSDRRHACSLIVFIVLWKSSFFFKNIEQLKAVNSFWKKSSIKEICYIKQA